MRTAPRDNFIQVNGARIRYWREGNRGVPLLLIHGLGGSAENWIANVSPLAERHRVYVMDLPGFGRSDKIPVRSIHDLVSFIGDFMDALQIEKASLAGNSLGGGLVLGCAVEHPERVEKLVLADIAGMGRDVIVDFKLCSVPLLGELLIRTGRKSAAATWRKIVYDPAVVPGELVSLTHELMAQPGAKKALLAAIRAGLTIRGQRMSLVRELTAHLGSVTAPALIIWGRQDRILPLDHAYICHRKLHGSRLEILDGCGHLPQLEHPEEFNQLALEFLDEHPAV